MWAGRGDRLSVANTLSVGAIVLALGGAALAAGGRSTGTVAKNSVGTVQLRDDAVTGAIVKNYSLTAKDIHGRVRKGRRGPKGKHGLAGATGALGPVGPAGLAGHDGTSGADATGPPAVRTIVVNASSDETASGNTLAAVIQSVATSTSSATPTKLMLTPGTYFIPASLTVLPAGLEITGTGDATIKFPAGHHWSIQDLTLDRITVLFNTTTIPVEGVLQVDGTLRLRDSAVEPGAGSASGVLIAGQGTLDIVDSFVSNYGLAADGTTSAIAFTATGPSSILGSTVQGDQATNGIGEGLAALGGVWHVANSIVAGFVSGATATRAAAIRIESGATVRVDHSQVIATKRSQPAGSTSVAAFDAAGTVRAGASMIQGGLRIRVGADVTCIDDYDENDAVLGAC